MFIGLEGYLFVYCYVLIMQLFSYTSLIVIGLAVNLSFVASGRNFSRSGTNLGRSQEDCGNERTDPTVIRATMSAVCEGKKIAVQECQYQFRFERWNCTTLDSGRGQLSRIMQNATKESAFAVAIEAAAVAYKITKSCRSQANEECGCDKSEITNDTKGGKGNSKRTTCSDDVEFAISRTRSILEKRERKRHDARAAMMQHNRETGFKVVRKHQKVRCRCHGPTTSCVTQTCWRELKHFRHTGGDLKSRYNQAIRVTVRQDGPPISLVPVKKKSRLSKQRLVFLERSPKYCDYRPNEGYLGVSGRECNKTSNGRDGCRKLCCGRGYKTEERNQTTRCDCRFRWCCQIECQVCEEIVNIHTCKAEGRRKKKDRRGKGKKGKSRRRKKPAKHRKRSLAQTVHVDGDVMSDSTT